MDIETVCHRVMCPGTRDDYAHVNCKFCRRRMKAGEGLICLRWYPKVARQDNAWWTLKVIDEDSAPFNGLYYVTDDGAYWGAGAVIRGRETSSRLADAWYTRFCLDQIGGKR